MVDGNKLGKYTNGNERRFYHGPWTMGNGLKKTITGFTMDYGPLTMD